MNNRKIIPMTPAEWKAKKEKAAARKAKRIQKGIDIGLRNKRGKTKVQLFKILKKETWDICSKVVRQRDGHKCILCGSTKGLSAHHWIIHARGSLATRFIEANCVTLCYACHIFKVHARGDAGTLDQIKTYMIGRFLDLETYEKIKLLGNGISDMAPEELAEIKFALEARYAKMVQE